MTPFFIGFDRRETVVYQVAAHTLRRSTPAALVYPLVQDLLRAEGLYDREDTQASTDFSLTRFLVPQLSGFRGWAVFSDCDFLFTRDVMNKLRTYARWHLPLNVVKHDYTPRSETKMGGRTQHKYPRKNWSSFMLFNCEHSANRLLTAATVNKMPPAWLHQFEWLDGYEIGELPIDMNFLVGEYPSPDAEADTLVEPSLTTPTCLHYTLGIGPYKPPVKDYAALWQAKLMEVDGDRVH
jgi:hypothetical protein